MIVISYHGNKESLREDSLKVNKQKVCFFLRLLPLEGFRGPGIRLSP